MSKLGRTIAIVNQKGGVGKTTTSINLAAALTQRGKTVLVIDLDPQGNASTGLGLDQKSRDVTLYDVLLNAHPMTDAVYETSVKNLYLVPSHIDLSAAEFEIGDQAGRTGRLATAMQDIRNAYDYIFIDCPPALGLLTVNALSAADSVLVPLQCEFFALEGLSQLLKTVEMTKSSLNTDLVIEGVMLTMYDKRNRLSAQVADDVRHHLGRAVFKTLIPRNVRVAEAPSFALPVMMYDPNSSGAVAYGALADELLDRQVARDAARKRAG